jgi:hypothetical protein
LAGTASANFFYLRFIYLFLLALVYPNSALSNVCHVEGPNKREFETETDCFDELESNDPIQKFTPDSCMNKRIHQTLAD